MVGALVIGIVLVSSALIVVAGTLAVRDRPLELLPLILVGIVGLALAVQAIILVVRVAGGQRPESLVLVGSYLVAVVLVPPVGALWALGERTRWGNVVLVVTGLTVATMTVRLWDLWHPVS